jgi:hypothetical protein
MGGRGREGGREGGEGGRVPKMEEKKEEKVAQKKCVFSSLLSPSVLVCGSQ